MTSFPINPLGSLMKSLRRLSSVALIMCQPSTKSNDPMVHAVILVVGFCLKLTRKVAFSRKPVFDPNNKFTKT